MIRSHSGERRAAAEAAERDVAAECAPRRSRCSSHKCSCHDADLSSPTGDGLQTQKWRFAQYEVSVAFWLWHNRFSERISIVFALFWSINLVRRGIQCVQLFESTPHTGTNKLGLKKPNSASHTNKATEVSIWKRERKIAEIMRHTHQKQNWLGNGIGSHPPYPSTKCQSMNVNYLLNLLCSAVWLVSVLYC